MRLYSKKRLSLKRFIFCFFYTLFVIILIHVFGSSYSLTITNTNNVKSIQSYRLKDKEENSSQKEEIDGTLKYLYINNIDDINLNCLDKAKIDDNLLYEDLEYGKIEIFSANNNFICGSIITVSTNDNQESYGIIGNIDDNIQNNSLEVLNLKEIENFNNLMDITYKIKRINF